MDRMACVSVPALPLQRLLTHHPDWRDHPVVVVDEDKPQGLIQCFRLSQSSMEHVDSSFSGDNFDDSFSRTMMMMTTCTTESQDLIIFVEFMSDVFSSEETIVCVAAFDVNANFGCLLLKS